MPREKKASKGKRALNEGQSSMEAAADNPSEECKQFLIQIIVNFFESETSMSLESKYLRYQEESTDKFKMDMRQKMLEALNTPLWHHDTDKKNFTKFLESKVHDALWNSKVLLVKYGKEHRANDEAFEDVILKADLFIQRCKPFAKKRNRQGSVGWWNGDEGRAAIARSRQHLIALPDTARVIPQDGPTMRGGYATIRKVRIEGCPGILPFWEFAAKQSLQQNTKPQLAKLEHQNESMAVRIPHAGVIRFNAVHSVINEGYSYWWNGGTLRQMLNLDREYPDNIAMHLGYCNPTEKQLTEAKHLALFRRKRTELAWAFMHIMNAVHLAKFRHNDISPDNIMFHFPADESKVYIGVCDWGMATTEREEVKSLYTFTSQSDMDATLRTRYWVDPRIAYLHKKGADVQIIPTLSLKSETYAVGKIAERINRHSMSVDYAKLQRETPSMSTFSHGDLAVTFHTYLGFLFEQNCTHVRGTLSHIVTRFTNLYNWPVPDEHFRYSY